MPRHIFPCKTIIRFTMVSEEFYQAAYIQFVYEMNTAMELKFSAKTQGYKSSRFDRVMTNQFNMSFWPSIALKKICLRCIL